MRSTKSTTSSSAKALSSDSIGTACRTLAKPRAGAAPTLRDGDFERAQIGKARLDRGVAVAQRVVFGVGDRRRVLLVIALVVRGDLGREPRVLGLRLPVGEQLDGRFDRL